MQNSSSTTDQPLYRSEALIANASRQLGAIRLIQPISYRIIVFVSTTIAIAIICFAIFGSVTKKARAAGITVPLAGSLTIAAPNAGILVRSFVSEGQIVVDSQKLFEISTERAGNQGEITAMISQQIATRMQSLVSERRFRKEQFTDKKLSLTQRLDILTRETAQLQNEIAFAQRRLDLAEKSFEKYNILQDSGYVSVAQTQQKQEDLIDIGSRLSSLNRNRVQLQATELNFKSELAALGNTLQTDLAQLDRAQASLQQEMAENHNRKASLILAPKAGIVTTITYQAGQAVSSGQALATLIPSSDAPDKSGVEVHLYVPSRTSGFVAVGQRVLIRYAAFPFQKFGLQNGKVIDVSKTPFAPNELPQNLASTILSNAQQSILGFNSNEALYRIKVSPEKQMINAYGVPQQLKAGMTLEADVKQDERKIWEWIFEPLLTIAP